MSVSIVVPIYNSEGSLHELVSRVHRVLETLGMDYELIGVNDGSRDGSWQALSALTSQNPRVSGINLMRNFGQHNALLCGIRAARHDVIVTMDDDLQHPPEEIPVLLATLADGYDVVYGTPAREEHGICRNIASRMTKIALRDAMGAEIARKVSAFRAFHTELRGSFDAYRGPFVSIDVLLSWATTRFASVTVRHEPRRIGTSQYSLRKLFNHAVNMMTGFSAVPLQLASITGFACTLFGIGVLGFVLFRYFVNGGSVPGFPFLASVIAIFSGAQLFALGIIGEYLARMHFRMMDRPPYAVRGYAGTQQRVSTSKPEMRVHA